MIDCLKSWFIKKYNAHKLKKEQREKEILREYQAYKEEIKARLKKAAIRNKYDTYIEYQGTEIPGQENVYPERYDLVNARNTAENLMYNRLAAKFGNQEYTVHVMDLPWPPDNIYIYFKTEEDMIKTHRLYYKAHLKTETCELCANEGRH